MQDEKNKENVNPARVLNVNSAIRQGVRYTGLSGRRDLFNPNVLVKKTGRVVLKTKKVRPKCMLARR